MKGLVDEDTAALWAFKLGAHLPLGMFPAVPDGVQEMIRSEPLLLSPTWWQLLSASLQQISFFRKSPLLYSSHQQIASQHHHF